MTARKAINRKATPHDLGAAAAPAAADSAPPAASALPAAPEPSAAPEDLDHFLADRAVRIRILGKRVISDVIEIGRLLGECKERCGHGHWLPWLEAEFGWDERTAQRYMSAHALAGKYDKLSDLSIGVSSLYLLAAPSTPEPARADVLERAEAGERLRHEEVKAIIAAHSPEAVLQAARELGAEEEAEPQRGINTGVAMHPHAERGLDLYETPPEAVRALLAVESFTGPIWEPACGPGNIVRVLRAAGHRVVATDLVDYGCPDSTGGIDFLMVTRAPEGVVQIVTNPPFMHADDFVRRALSLVPRVIMLWRLVALEGRGRSDILDDGRLARVYPCRNRLQIHRDGWPGPHNSNPLALAWFVWDRDHRGPPTLHRISWSADDEAALRSPTASEPPASPVAADPPYDGLDDFAKSLDEGYRVIRERVAAGGPGWTPHEVSASKPQTGPPAAAEPPAPPREGGDQ